MSHPVAMRPPLGVGEARVGQVFDEHDRRSDGYGQAEHDARLDRPAKSKTQPTAGERAEGCLQQGTRHRNAAHGHEVIEGEVQAGAEHHEHDAHLGKLAHRMRISDEARGERPYRKTAEQVTHNRWEARGTGEDAAQKRRGGGGYKCGEENAVSVHVDLRVGTRPVESATYDVCMRSVYPRRPYLRTTRLMRRVHGPYRTARNTAVATP